MKNQKVMKTKLLLRMIAVMMVLVMTITCMDLKVSAKTRNTPEETTAKAETDIEIETTSQSDDELLLKSELNESVKEKETDVSQEKIDSSLYKDDSLADKITKESTELIEEPTVEGMENSVSLSEKTSDDIVSQDKTTKEEDDSETDFEPGEVIVRFKHSYTKLEIEEEFPKLNIKSTKDQNKLLYEAVKASSTYKKREMRKLEEEMGTKFVIKLKNKTKKSVKEAIEILEKNNNVDYAIPNYILEPTATPNDSGYSMQWGMNKIQAPEAWDTYTGSSTVTVGIIDSGIDSNHPDLSGNINTEFAYNAVTKTVGIEYTVDELGHGTHVAGIVGAKGNNAYGVTGVNWNVSMVPIKISYNAAGQAHVAAMAEAVRYAKLVGIPICNMSYDCPPDEDFRKEVEGYGGLLIMSAGNNGKMLIILISIQN